MATLTYPEGDCFAIPLRGGGYAAGVLARVNPKAALLGYCLRPRRLAVPSLNEVAAVGRSELLFVARLGHL